MTLREIAHSAQQQLETGPGSPFKRAHVYELLAASFGFKSYAALLSEALITQGQNDEAEFSAPLPAIRERCLGLGYRALTADIAAAEIAAFLEKNLLQAITVRELVDQLLECPGDDELSPLLLDGLNTAASKGNAVAHYALALILANEEEAQAEDRRGGDGSYWHSQERDGRILVGVQKEWADEYAMQVSRSESYTRHLRAAADLGSWRALVDLAERSRDPAFLERIDESAVDDAMRIAEVAGPLGLAREARRWLTKAAEAGNTSAMRDLIEDYDRNDLHRCWIWVYLARLVGTDLTRDKHYAINEDGSDYDEDVGGPAFVAGDEGVHLSPLEPQADLAAKQAAQHLFSGISPERVRKP